MRFFLNKYITIFLLILTSCQSREWRVPHEGRRNPGLVALSCDTLVLDAGKTSLLGQWLMAHDRLFFIDECIVGVKEYDLSGNYLGEHIRHGRGPDEMISPAWISAYNDSNNHFLIMDGGTGRLHCFNQDFKKCWETEAPFYMMPLDTLRLREKQQYLLNHPDPEMYEIYEYNLDCMRMQCWKDSLYIPVVSDHVRFNKYYRSAHSREYYRKAHLFLSCREDGDMSGMRLFGHYPPVYGQGTLSMFSEYDFYVNDEGVHVSFAADSLIYVLGKDGRVRSSFGFGDRKISGRYPAIRSFEEYEKQYRSQRKALGYYGRIACVGGYVFRTCQWDGGKGWTLQIYQESTRDMVGEINTRNPLEVLGCWDGVFYAYAGEDLQQEAFRIVRFRVRCNP